MGHILRGNCLLRNVIEGKREGREDEEEEVEQLLDDLKSCVGTAF